MIIAITINSFCASSVRETRHNSKELHNQNIRILCLAGIILHLNRPRVHYGAEFSDCLRWVFWSRVLCGHHQEMRLRNRLDGERLHRALRLSGRPNVKSFMTLSLEISDILHSFLRVFLWRIQMISWIQSYSAVFRLLLIGINRAGPTARTHMLWQLGNFSSLRLTGRWRNLRDAKADSWIQSQNTEHYRGSYSTQVLTQIIYRYNKTSQSIKASRHLKSLTTWLFVWELFPVDNKGSIKGLHYWSYVKKVHWSPVDSPDRGPVMWKAFPCHDVFMIYPACMVAPHK